MKNKYLKTLALATAAFCTVALAGCGKTADTTTSSSLHAVTYENQQYQVPTSPQRIVTLSNSLLNVLNAVDGTSLARVDSTEKLPEKLQALPSLGHEANINMEQLLSLKPDLVLGLSTQHSKLSGQLEGAHIPFVPINYSGIADNVPLITFLGEITNHQDKAKEVIATYNKRIETVQASVKGVMPVRVAVLRATGKAVTAETDNAITASMVKLLGMDNVVLKHGGFDKNAKTVPYSLETLAADDPDVIFISTMGEKDEIQATMAKEMTNNPAWQNLKAVKNGKVFYLPSNWFLLNPGLQTPDALAVLVKDAYGITVKP